MREAPGTSQAAFGRRWRSLLRGLPRRAASAWLGGREPDYIELVEWLRAHGSRYGFTGALLAASAQVWAVHGAIGRFGSARQRRRFLAPMCRGTATASIAITEREAGSDVLAMAAEARPAGDGYRLYGEKRFVTGAVAADWLLTWARLPGRSGPASLVCLVVGGRARGVDIRPARWVMGAADAWQATVTFADCAVSSRQRLGKEGDGLSVLWSAMDMERGFLLAPAVGAMERRLREVALYAARRRQFGRPIAEQQAVAHRLAQMCVRVDAARELLYAGARTPAASGGRLAPSVKIFISEAWLENCLDAAQIMGGQACLGRFDLRDELGAAAASRLMSGSNDILKTLIARDLLADVEGKEGRAGGAICREGYQ